MKTFADPSRLAIPRAAEIPRIFIQCTVEGSRLPEEVARGVVGDRWQLRELPAGHWPMLSAPRELADLLMRIPV